LGVREVREAALQWETYCADLWMANPAAAKKLEDQEHSHWDWNWKARKYLLPTYRILGIRFGLDWQGLLLLDLRPRPSRLVAGRDVLYVEYVSTAPWNEDLPGHPPRLLGVGLNFLITAISHSRGLGCGGAIGLHSLPQSEEWYRRRGFKDLGVDPGYYELVYFELSSGSAEDIAAGRSR
jgi:hypothetical protein